MKKVAKAIIGFVTVAMIADDKANKPNVDADFTCPEFPVKEAWIQEKVTMDTNGTTVRRHLVIKTPMGVRYLGISEALDAKLLGETSNGYEALAGYQLSYTAGQPVVTA